MPRPRKDPTAPEKIAGGAGDAAQAAEAARVLGQARLVVHSLTGPAGSAVWAVTGETLANRDLLREAGGRWNKMDTRWEFEDDPSLELATAIAARPATVGSNSGVTTRPQPHYWGHRERVRERVVTSGIGGLQDYELLELLLFYAIERRDTKPLAKSLLQRFHTLGDVLAADATLLREVGIDKATLVMFRAIRESAIRLARNDVVNQPSIGSWDRLLDYCRTSLQHNKTEQFRILFLDRKNVLIRDELQQEGTVDHTPVYPREVVKRALALGASAIVMVHNHPSGDPTPSREDIAMTREVKAAAQALGIELHDHIVVGRSGHTSFRSKGLL